MSSRINCGVGAFLKSYVVAIVSVGSIAVIGTIALVMSHAETSNAANLEVERGSATAPAVIVDDGSASSGRAVRFGGQANGAVLFDSDYSNAALNTDGTPGNWTTVQAPTPDRISVANYANTPGGIYKPSGNSMRVELRPGDRYNSSGYVAPRAEVYGRTPTYFSSTAAQDYPDPVGSVRWYRFDVYVPSGHVFATDGTPWELLAQFKGVYGGSPPLALEINRDSWRLGGTRTNSGLIAGNGLMGKVATGQWTRIVIGQKLSTSASDGWVEAYVNGVLKVSRTSLATLDVKSDGTPDPIYLKVGIYRSDAWDAIGATHVFYFGDTLVGTTREAVQ